MFTGPEIVDVLSQCGVTHVIWIPDSDTGKWESALEAAGNLALVRVCREGEAWPLAAGMYLGGKSPVIVMQTTGLFESGDSMRNVLFDLQLPIFAIVGARNWLVADSQDSAKLFAEPNLKSWGIDYRLIGTAEEKPILKQHYTECREAEQPGVVLLAEGAG